MHRQSYGNDRAQFVDISTVKAPRGTVVSIHGGYWRAKYGLDLNQPIVEHLVSIGFNVANVEYRRVTAESNGVWDEMSTDVLAAIATVRDFPGPLVLLGHSAGGQLAQWASAQPDVNASGVIALASVCDLFLADGLELSNHATFDLFGVSAAERPDLYMSASPLHLLPTGVDQLIVHGRADKDVPFEMTGEYVETAEALGENVTFLDPKKVDHFDVIDPTHAIWRDIDDWLIART